MENTGIIVKGKTIDAHTRCMHYNSPLDIIAIKMKCCDTYYPCIFCHEEDTGHITMVWPKDEFDTKAILCGACHSEMTINEYLHCKYQCPACKAAFNPGCANHNHLYFES